MRLPLCIALAVTVAGCDTEAVLSGPEAREACIGPRLEAADLFPVGEGLVWVFETEIVTTSGFPSSGTDTTSGTITWTFNKGFCEEDGWATSVTIQQRGRDDVLSYAQVIERRNGIVTWREPEETSAFDGLLPRGFDVDRFAARGRDTVAVENARLVLGEGVVEVASQGCAFRTCTFYNARRSG